MPVEVTQQRDFLVRCDANVRLWRPERFMPPGCSVNTLINQRTQFSKYDDYCPPDWGLDVYYARNHREYAYADSLSTVVINPDWLDDKRFFDERLLFRTRSMIAPTGEVPSDENVDEYMPYLWRRWERAGRNRHGVFLAVQHREVLAMKPVVVRSKYPALPPEWVRFEVPYGFNPQCPPVVTYYGLELAWNPLGGTHTSDFWKVLFTEHAWTAAVELIHEARRGRLWWLPSELLNGMEQIGLSALCFDDISHTEELEALIVEIRLIRWSRVPRSNGIIPPWNKYATPVFNSGDFVEFDPEEWCTRLKPEMYLPHDEYNRPVGPLDDRGAPQFVRLNGRVSDPVPDADIYASRESSDDVAPAAEPMEITAVGDTRTVSQAPLDESSRPRSARRLSEPDDLSRFDTLDISGLNATVDREPDSSLLPPEEAEVWLARGPTPLLESPQRTGMTNRRQEVRRRPHRLTVEAHLVDVTTGRARVISATSEHQRNLIRRTVGPCMAIAAESSCRWLTAPPLPAPESRRHNKRLRLCLMDTIDVDALDESSD